MPSTSGISKRAGAIAVLLLLLSHPQALFAAGPDAAEGVDAAPPPAASGAPAKARAIVIAPCAGFIRHVLPAMGRSPEQVGWGPETGLFFGYFRESLSLIAFPYWADVNGSYVWGGATHLDLYFGNKRWYNPLVGFGMDYTKIDDQDTEVGDLNIFAPWIKAGMRFKLPVRGLSIAPYAAYLFQLVDMSRMEQTYHSALFGANLTYTVNRSFTATLKYYYSYTPDGRNGHDLRFRLIYAMTKRLGVFFRAEYAKQVVDEYVTVLAGPSILF